MPRLKPRTNEKRLFAFHKSIVSQAKRLRNLIALILVAVGLSFPSSYDYVYLAVIILMIGAAVYSFWIFLIWFSNVVVVTNQRIIVISRDRAFHQKIAEFDIVEIRNVGYETKGIVQTLFRAGDINLELSGGSLFVINNIYSPQEIHDSIRALIRAHRQ